MQNKKILIVGGGFAGLVCAKALAQRGVDVTLLERKSAAGVGMHTTGIIVKECADEFEIPTELTRKVTNVRLYAPNLRYTDLVSNDYFFLTTDTPGLMRHFSDEAIKAGAKLHYDTSYNNAKLQGDRVVVYSSTRRGEAGRGASTVHTATSEHESPHPNPPPNGEGIFTCDFLIGADGPRSKVADDFNLGQNTKFLLGAEAEYNGIPLHDTNAFYCFLDQKLAHGYLGWVIPGVGVTQIGVAQRMPKKPDIDAFVARMKNEFDFSQSAVVARRGGLIPCGGLVEPFANEHVILLGDAAGIVSPLTAGGIHTALRYGRILGEVMAQHITEGGPHPAQVLHKIYPRFHFKLTLRKLFELTPDWALNLAIGNSLFSFAAKQVFYQKKRLK